MTTLVADGIQLAFLCVLDFVLCSEGKKNWHSNNQMKRKFGLQLLIALGCLWTPLSCLWRIIMFFFSCQFRKSRGVAGERTHGRCSYLDVVPLIPSPESARRSYREKASIQGRHWEKALWKTAGGHRGFELASMCNLKAWVASVAWGYHWERNQWNFAHAFPHLGPGVPMFTPWGLRPPIKYRQQMWMGAEGPLVRTHQTQTGISLSFFPSVPPPGWWVMLKRVNCPKDAFPPGTWGWNLDPRKDWVTWWEMKCGLLAPGTLTSSSSYLGSNSWRSTSLRSSNFICSPFLLKSWGKNELLISKLWQRSNIILKEQDQGKSLD